jgi:hypothetical protein
MPQLIADWCSMRNDNYIGFPAVTDTHLGDKILNHITKEVVIKLIEHVSLGTIYIIKSYWSSNIPYSRNGQVLYSILADIFRYPYRRSIWQLILFLKINDRYVSDISPIRISNKYRTINVIWWWKQMRGDWYNSCFLLIVNVKVWCSLCNY